MPTMAAKPHLFSIARGAADPPCVQATPRLLLALQAICPRNTRHGRQARKDAKIQGDPPNTPKDAKN